MRTWEKFAAVALGIGAAAVTIIAIQNVVSPPGPPVSIFQVDPRLQSATVNPNAPVLFGNRYSARSLWSSDAMGN